MPERNIVEDIKFAQEIINKNRNGLEVVKALAKGGFPDVAQDMLNIQKAKLTGDYLHLRHHCWRGPGALGRE